LQHIAAERRHVTELRARGKLQRLSDDRIISADFGVLGRGRHRHKGPETEPAIAALDAHSFRVEAVDVDHHLRAHHVELHQVEQGRTAGQKLRRRHRRRDRVAPVCGHLHCLGEAAGTLVEEGAHLVSSASRLWPG
jgi:hypothetical protein